MTKRLLQKLIWGPVSSGTTYLYGSGIDYAESAVIFENLNFASGKPIRKWRSRTNYQGNRTSPELPVLEPGGNYWLESEIRSWPEQCFYLQLDFYNRQEEIIDYKILKVGESQFNYPKNAFTYTITLYSAGCRRLHFSHLNLYQEKESSRLFIPTTRNIENPFNTQEEVLTFIAPLLEGNLSD